MRLLFARVGRTICRQCGTRGGPRDGRGGGRPRCCALPEGTRLLVGFDLPRDRRSAGRPQRRRRRRRRRGRGRRRAGRGGMAPEAAGPRRTRCAVEALRRKGFGRLLVDGRAVAFDDVATRGLSTSRRRCRVVVDRLRASRRRRATRLTDSIETAYQRGRRRGVGACNSARSGAPDGVARFQRALRVPRLRHRLRRPAAAALLVQQPVRRLPDLPRVRQHHRARHRSGRAGPARSRSAQGAIEPWTKPHYRAQLAELKRAAKARGVPPRRAVARPDATRSGASSSRATARTSRACAGSSAGSSARSTRCTSACS